MAVTGSARCRSFLHLRPPIVLIQFMKRYELPYIYLPSYSQIVDRLDSVGDVSGSVPRNPIRRLRGMKRSLLGRQSIRKRVETCLQSLGDEDFVQARRQLVHEAHARSSPVAPRGLVRSVPERHLSVVTGGTGHETVFRPR